MLITLSNGGVISEIIRIFMCLQKKPNLKRIEKTTTTFLLTDNVKQICFIALRDNMRNIDIWFNFLFFLFKFVASIFNYFAEIRRIYSFVLASIDSTSNDMYAPDTDQKKIVSFIRLKQTGA